MSINEHSLSKYGIKRRTYACMYLPICMFACLCTWSSYKHNSVNWTCSQVLFPRMLWMGRGWNHGCDFSRIKYYSIHPLSIMKHVSLFRWMFLKEFICSQINIYFIVIVIIIIALGPLVWGWLHGQQESHRILNLNSYSLVSLENFVVSCYVCKQIPWFFCIWHPSFIVDNSVLFRL